MSNSDDDRGGFPCPIDGHIIYPRFAAFNVSQGTILMVGCCETCSQQGLPPETYARVPIEPQIAQEALSDGLPWFKPEEQEE
mgnify:CR=1 FL=1